MCARSRPNLDINLILRCRSIEADVVITCVNCEMIRPDLEVPIDESLFITRHPFYYEGMFFLAKWNIIQFGGNDN